MIQQQSLLKVADNSGAKIVKCIKVIGGFNRSFAYVGDVIIISILKLRNKSRSTSKVKKGEVYKALILRTKKELKKKVQIFILTIIKYVFLTNKENQ